MTRDEILLLQAQCREMADAIEADRPILLRASATAHLLRTAADRLPVGPSGWHNGELYCYGGCGTRYSDFASDVSLPTSLWNRIAVGHPFDETQENIEREGRGGVLCPTCIISRLAALPERTVIFADVDCPPGTVNEVECAQLRQERDALAAEIAGLRATRDRNAVIVDELRAIRDWMHREHPADYQRVDDLMTEFRAARGSAPSRDPVSPQEQCPKCGNMAHSDSPFNVCIQAAAPPVEE